MAKEIYRLKPNPGKKLTIEVNGQKYNRYPIKTKVVSAKDNILEVVKEFAALYLEQEDTLIISERVVAIAQGRMRAVKDIKPGFWAKNLVKFVYRPSWGIGIGSPQTFQMAIEEAGLLKILLAGAISALTKPFGIKGMFYKIAGSGINAIDGPTEYTLPPGNEAATLGPKDPDAVAQQIADKFNVNVVIIDANDIGRRVEGASAGVNRAWACEVFRDNPLGQSRQQTPIAIVRQL